MSCTRPSGCSTLRSVIQHFAPSAELINHHRQLHDSYESDSIRLQRRQFGGIPPMSANDWLLTLDFGFEMTAVAETCP